MHSTDTSQFIAHPPDPAAQRARRGLARRLVLLFAALLLPMRGRLNAAETAPAYVDALKDYHAGRWDESMRRCKEIIAEYPEAVGAYQTLVAAARRKGEMAGVRAYLVGRSQRRPNDPYPRYALGLCDKEAQRYQDAREHFDRALRAAPGFAELFIELVESYHQANDLDAGIQRLRQWAGTHRKPATAFIGLGHGYELKQAPHKAMRNYNEAIRRDPSNLLAYRKRCALAKQVGDREAFFAAARMALRLAGKEEDHEALYKIHGSMGGVYSEMNHTAEAIRHYKEALQEARRVGDEAYQTQCAYEIGNLYIGFDDATQALPFLGEATRLSQKRGSRHYPWSLLRIGEAYFRMGDREKAGENYQKALESHRQLNDQSGICYGYKNLGDLQIMVGEYERALDYYQRALKLADGDLLREMILSALVRVQIKRGNYFRALEAGEQALALSEARGDELSLQAALGQLGSLYVKMNNPEKGARHLQRALQLAERRQQKEDAAVWLHQLGEAYRKSGKLEAAEAAYRRAVTIAEQLRHTRMIQQALQGWGATREAKGDTATALSLYRKAVHQVEEQRQRLVLDKEKSGYFEDKTELYESLVNLLMGLYQQNPKMEFIHEAFHYTERAKAQAFLQTLPQAQLLRYLKALSPVYADCLERNQKEVEQKYRQLIIQRAQWQEEIRRDIQLWNFSDTDRKNSAQAVEARKAEIAGLEGDIDRLRKEHAQLLGHIKKSLPGFAQLDDPEILSTHAVQALLRPGEVLIEYYVQADKTVAFVISPTSVNGVKLTAGRTGADELRDVIQRMVERFRANPAQASRTMDEEFTARMRMLYEVFFRPLEQYIPAGSRLIVVPDDALSYLPFGMLIDGTSGARPSFLVEHFPISYAYSASLLNPTLWSERRARRVPRLDVLAVGNPDRRRGSSPGWKGWLSRLRPAARGRSIEEETFPPLPYAEREVETIARFFRHARVLTGKAATETAFKREAHDARIIHLAAHNAVDTETVWQSRIILSPDEKTGMTADDGFLYTYEIFNLDLNADLVVLSGCETGLGKLKRGEGLMGMSRAFLYAGAPSLMASLWPIVDGYSTEQLMKGFYANIAKGMDKRDALQNAQVELIRGRGYAHPFFWAPFILVGDTAIIPIETPAITWSHKLILGLALALTVLSLMRWKRPSATTPTGSSRRCRPCSLP